MRQSIARRARGRLESEPKKSGRRAPQNFPPNLKIWRLDDHIWSSRFWQSEDEDTNILNLIVGSQDEMQKGTFLENDEMPNEIFRAEGISPDFQA